MITKTPPIFFGTSDFAVYVLTELSRSGYKPSFVVTNPDRPRGRALQAQETPVAEWCRSTHVPTVKPSRLHADVLKEELRTRLGMTHPLYFLVAAYGSILPRPILEIPERGCINIHPSLLPRHRGPSPIQETLLTGDTETGVSIMLMDEKIDHGPIIASERIPLPSPPPPRRELETILGRLGGVLASKTIPLWLSGTLKPAAQDDASATYTKLISKSDGLISLEDDPQKNFRAFLAYDGWPGVFFQTERKGQPYRVKITSASLQNGTFVITRVRPEGGTDISWEDFMRGYGDPRRDSR